LPERFPLAKIEAGLEATGKRRPFLGHGNSLRTAFSGERGLIVVSIACDFEVAGEKFFEAIF
jgi:hypothetical protein